MASVQSRSNYLGRIVNFLKNHYMAGRKTTYRFDELIKGSSLSHIDTNTRTWLLTDGLFAHPKIKTTPERRYVYNPPLPCVNSDELYALLTNYYKYGKGFILWDDVVDSLDNALTILEEFENDKKIIVMARENKKFIVFNHFDGGKKKEVNPDIVKLWHSCSVSGLDDARLFLTLESQGIKGFPPDLQQKRTPLKRTPLKREKKIKDNDYMMNVLEPFKEEDTTIEGEKVSSKDTNITINFI